MSLLKTTPAAAVRSLDEMFAIAHAMEHEAATRYAAFAQQARSEGVPEMGDLFEQLAKEERDHEISVAQWSQQRSGKAPDPANIRWELPETFDNEAAGILATSRLASMYRILSMAVRNEERAFAFWSYVAAEAETAEIRAAAERMAHEELGHVALLRRARRQAYHAERKDHSQDHPRSPSGRLADAAVLERRLADQLEALAERLSGDRRMQARDWAAQSRSMANEAARLSLANESNTPDDWDAAATAERLVEDYLDVSDLSRDEDVASQAQSLAKRAISRLAWLRASSSDMRST
ncbi:MAG: ferritin-like domain-containing protein [Rhizomicrobium sp.]